MHEYDGNRESTQEEEDEDDDDGKEDEKNHQIVSISISI